MKRILKGNWRGTKMNITINQETINTIRSSLKIVRVTGGLNVKKDSEKALKELDAAIKVSES
jgi:hypothetical protein